MDGGLIHACVNAPPDWAWEIDRPLPLESLEPNVLICDPDTLNEASASAVLPLALWLNRFGRGEPFGGRDIPLVSS